MTDTARSQRHISRLMNIMIGVVLTTFVALVGVIIYSAVTPEPFQPIEFEPVSIERVTDDGIIQIPQVEGFDAPSVMLGDPIPVLAKRCSNENDIFEVTATTWFVHQPSGTVYPTTTVDVKAEIEPGCLQIRFETHPTPQMVADILDIGSDDDSEAVAWTYEGELNPDLDGAENSIFRSEAFIIVPMG